MTLVVINCYVLDVFPFMICVPLHIDYYIPLLDIILIIRYTLWGMCHMLAEQHLVVPLWRSVWMFSKKKKKGVVTHVGYLTICSINKLLEIPISYLASFTWSVFNHFFFCHVLVQMNYDASVWFAVVFKCMV